MGRGSLRNCRGVWRARDCRSGRSRHIYQERQRPRSSPVWRAFLRRRKVSKWRVVAPWSGRKKQWWISICPWRLEGSWRANRHHKSDKPPPRTRPRSWDWSKRRNWSDRWHRSELCQKIVSKSNRGRRTNRERARSSRHLTEELSKKLEVKFHNNNSSNSRGSQRCRAWVASSSPL